KRGQDWNAAEIGDALYALICEVVDSLREDKLRLAARAALNIGDTSVAGRSTLNRRQKNLAAAREVHWDTVREWWRVALKRIAAALATKAAELNDAPNGWEAYRADRPGRPMGDDIRPNFSLTRVDVTWRLIGKVGRELVSYRWLVAHADGIDRYPVQS